MYGVVSGSINFVLMPVKLEVHGLVFHHPLLSSSLLVNPTARFEIAIRAGFCNKSRPQLRSYDYHVVIIFVDTTDLRAQA